MSDRVEDWDDFYRSKGQMSASEETEARERGEYGVAPVSGSKNSTFKKKKGRRKKEKRKAKTHSFRKGAVSAFGLSKARVRF